MVPADAPTTSAENPGQPSRKVSQVRKVSTVVGATSLANTANAHHINHTRGSGTPPVSHKQVHFLTVPGPHGSNDPKSRKTSTMPPFSSQGVANPVYNPLDIQSTDSSNPNTADWDNDVYIDVPVVADTGCPAKGPASPKKRKLGMMQQLPVSMQNSSDNLHHVTSADIPMVHLPNSGSY